MPTVLFLGGGSDIAQATERLFAENKYDIILAGRDQDFLVKIHNDLMIRYGIQVWVYPFDALDYAAHPDFLKGLPVFPDIGVCAFGYLGDQNKAQQDWEESSRILGSNYSGAVSILNLLAETYEKAGKGVIVGISSVAGERGRKSNYLYGSAKAGFSAYLSGLRNRLSGSGVRVITVKPGFVDTRMTRGLPLPALLTASPEEVARSIYRAVKRGQNIIYVKGIWRGIMYLIRNIPENLFKKMNL